jgi:hypothetical protein
MAMARSRYGVGPDDAFTSVAAKVDSVVPGLSRSAPLHDGYDGFKWAHERHLRREPASGQHRGASGGIATGLVDVRPPRVRGCLDRGRSSSIP